MSLSERNFDRTSAKFWLCHVKNVELTHKTAILPINGNLYHYAGNNPVKYTDPDGRMDTENTTTTNQTNVPNASLDTITIQIPTDPNDYHCDIYAWNQAIENGMDPRGQGGETPDLNEINVSTFYEYFPNNRHEGSPVENSEGYAFYDGTSNNNDDPTHVEYYVYQTGDSYTRYRTDGIDEPVQEQRNINDPRNENWTYIPLDSNQ